MNPAFDRQDDRKRARWGIVHDAPNSFVWEIGHRSDFSQRPAASAPGHNGCESYNSARGGETLPIQILGVKFGNRGPAKHWAVVSDYGGKAQILDPSDAARPPTAARTASTPGTRTERRASLRRQLPDDRRRLRQGQPVRAAHALRRPVRREQHLLHDPDPVADSMGRPLHREGPAPVDVRTQTRELGHACGSLRV